MRYLTNINQVYFANEGRKYLKQFIVMNIYNRQLRKWKECECSIIGFDEPRPTLKEVWASVNAYVESLSAVYHTCEEPETCWVENYRKHNWSID